ncbi:MAG TPA: Gfo/Idh/MocA family oxidoreductase [Gemmatimonadaceae bacterium]|nr:Gfo/Idh/MocA family oxidoreductase [Gemmatimonadaceae bacterium]
MADFALRVTRTAVIGLGEAGATIHLPALTGIAGATVVGAVDTDDARRQAAASKWNVPVFGDVSEMLGASKPELVIVASPPALHAAHCRAALDAGAHVLCEKPFAASVYEARDLVSYATQRGKQIAVNHEFRAMPIFRDMLGQVRADPSGVAVAQVWQAINHNPASEKGWRGSLRRRSLYEAGVHLVDLALQLFGETPHTVRATFSSGGADSVAADAITLVTLEFSRGRLAQLTQCRVHRGDRQYLEVRADTANASFRASFGGRMRVSAGMVRSTRPHLAIERGGSGVAWREHGAARAMFARNGGAPLVSSTRDVIRSCIAAIQAGRPVPFPATDGVDTLRVVAAAYRSAELGRAVQVDGDDSTTTESLLLTETLNA